MLLLQLRTLRGHSARVGGKLRAVRVFPVVAGAVLPASQQLPVAGYGAFHIQLRVPGWRPHLGQSPANAFGRSKGNRDADPNPDQLRHLVDLSIAIPSGEIDVRENMARIEVCTEGT